MTWKKIWWTNNGIVIIRKITNISFERSLSIDTSIEEITIDSLEGRWVRGTKEERETLDIFEMVVMTGVEIFDNPLRID